MSWRDTPVPGRGTLPAGAPLSISSPANSPKPAALRGYVATAVVHERTATTALSNRVRVALTVIALLDILCPLVLYGWLRPARLDPWMAILANIMSWGGNWELVCGVAALAGIALVSLGAVTDWFMALTQQQLYAVWAAVLASAVTTGLCLAVAVVTAVVISILGIIGGFFLVGFFWALATNDW